VYVCCCADFLQVVKITEMYRNAGKTYSKENERKQENIENRKIPPDVGRETDIVKPKGTRAPYAIHYAEINVKR
jgi:hypothetical protein